jgi:hypothetical protein
MATSFSGGRSRSTQEVGRIGYDGFLFQHETVHKFCFRFDYDNPDFIQILANVDFVFKNAAAFRPGNFFPILDKIIPDSKVGIMYKIQY